MENRYELEKYKGMKSRFDCPACHTKKVFTRYVDTYTGEYLSPEVGRCNREDKCGYHYTPKQYFEQHPEKRGYYGNDTSKNGKVRSRLENGKSQKSDNAYHIKKTETEPIDKIPKEYLIKSVGYNSNFVRFLCSIFDRHTLESPTISRLMKEYYFGYTKDKSIIFWQIDEQKRIRTGKIMQYNPLTGKRIKNDIRAINWVHSKLKKDKILSDNWELSQCLFGEHLLINRPNDTVCLVESEKSAIIGSGTMPGYIWLATGGKQNLKADKCECLKGRSVILFPDLGAFEQWQEKGKKIAVEVGFNITVSAMLEQVATDEDKENGLDIADFLIRQLKNKILSEEKQRENELKRNINSLTKEEIAIKQMAAKNPLILQFIDVLGLVSATNGKQLNL